jgi:hypothetical protein
MGSSGEREDHDEKSETEDVGEKRMEGGYGRGIPGVVSDRIPVYRVEVNIE